jgi:hypothetical protein
MFVEHNHSNRLVGALSNIIGRVLISVGWLWLFFYNNNHLVGFFFEFSWDRTGYQYHYSFS